MCTLTRFSHFLILVILYWFIESSGFPNVVESRVDSAGLLAKTIQTEFQGEGGSYSSWLSNEFPILVETKLGGGILSLQPLGLALPHYADCSKIGYITQGTARVGVILSGTSEEKVLRLEKGDMLPILRGSISWWFNDGNAVFTVVFLGDTSTAQSPGNFTYFFVAGIMSIFNGFSTDLLMSAFGLPEEQITMIVKSQAGALVVKLKEDQKMPEPSKTSTERTVYSTETALPNVIVKNGGQLVHVTSAEFGLMEDVGFSSAIVTLQKNAMYAPEYSSVSAYQMNYYIVKGSGRVQVVAMGGQTVLDETVRAGDLFIVPRFFVVSVIAAEEGVKWLSIFTTQKPVFAQLAGRTSIWKALSPQLVQAALNITPELEKVFRSKMSKNDIIFPG